MSDAQRPIPTLDDITLDYVTLARQRTTQRALSLAIPGLDGDVQQVLGRSSYEIEIQGVLVGEGVADKLSALQKKIAGGAEIPFSADITTALELDKVIVAAAEFQEVAARPGYYNYRLLIRESPPLPPPAELSSFGGLEGFDLGFDTSVLGDIASAAGDLQNAVNQVSGALDALQALAGLGDLSLSNPMSPMLDQAGQAGSAGGDAPQAASGLSGLLGGS
jgi:hypothetical protein